MQTVSNYCQYPSPGKKFWQDGSWARHPLGGTMPRRNTWRSWACDDFPGYNGPAAHPVRRRGLPAEPSWAEIEDRSPFRNKLEDTAWLRALEEKHSRKNATVQDLVANNDTGDAGQSGGGLAAVPEQRVGGGAGSFLDASAFLYLGCATNDDDPCYYMGDACSESDGDDYTVPEPAPSPTTTTEPPTTTTEPTPTPTEKTALCKYGYVTIDLVSFAAVHIYNIQGWAEDGGDRLHVEESGCGDIAEWEWRDVGASGVGHEVVFYLDVAIEAVCVERAIKSAGGPDGVQCKLS